MQINEEREAITLTNKGQKIFGILHRPLTQERVPAVLFCSGFGGNKCGKNRLFVHLAEQLVKANIAVFRFDYRGCGDSEGSFQEVTIQGKLSDTLTCLHWLTHHPHIDSQRIGLLGRSLGGLISILATRHYLTSIKSLVLWAPVFYSKPWKIMWEQFKVDHQDDREPAPLPPHVPNLQFLQEFFNVNILDELHQLRHLPLLHLQGLKDPIVTVDHAEEYQRARSGIESTRFVLLPNGDHDFSDLASQELAIQETVAWYRQTL